MRGITERKLSTPATVASVATATTTKETTKMSNIHNKQNSCNILLIIRIAMLCNLLQLLVVTKAQIIKTTATTTTMAATSVSTPTTTMITAATTTASTRTYGRNDNKAEANWQIPSYYYMALVDHNNNDNGSDNDLNNTLTLNNNNLSTPIMEIEWEAEMSYHPYCMAQRNSFVDLFTVVLYAIVCIVGLFGNTLVIYVVLRFSKMQTVTNIYILNLAIADECFLIGIPFLLYTMRICSWRFGEYMCKAYMVSTSITQFTSSIFLLIMSADRYIAVCHPIASPRYRTLHIAKIVSAVAWLTSAVLMLPVILYASTVRQEDGVHLSCNIEWPETYKIHTGTTFILYTFFLGFATPLCFILCFYYLVIRKLHAVGVKHKSKEKKRSHRKVTRLVLTVITVYILCWLPHWISQVALINSNPAHSDLSRLEIAIFLLLGCLVYSNSAMNPILYAFLSDNFRKSFFKAFTCMTRHEVNAQLQVEQSVFTKQGSRRRGSRRLMCQTLKPNDICQVNAMTNNHSSTTTSSTTTAEKTATGTGSGGTGTTNSTQWQVNGRVAVTTEDVILVLDNEHSVHALMEREQTNEIVLQTDL